MYKNIHAFDMLARLAMAILSVCRDPHQRNLALAWISALRKGCDDNAAAIKCEWIPWIGATAADCKRPVDRTMLPEFAMLPALGTKFAIFPVRSLPNTKGNY